VIAVVVPLELSRIFARCAPAVGPVTMSAIVTYESGGRRYAIGDNTIRRSFFPADRERAEALATQLLRAGHDIDLGYAQINSSNFTRFGLNARSAFDPCTNVATGARILGVAYVGAARTFGEGQVALVHALSAYNTGGYFAGMSYARGVYAMAAALHFERRPFVKRTTVKGYSTESGLRAVSFLRARRSPTGR